MDTTPARADEPIEAKPLSITKIVASVGSVAGLGVATMLGQLSAQGAPIQAAALGLVAVLALAVAVVIATDISARARVTCALAAERAAGTTARPQHEPAAPAATGPVISPVNLPVALSVRGAGGAYQVIAVRWDEQTRRTYYLAGRPGDVPQWRAQEDISDVRYPRAQDSADHAGSTARPGDERAAPIT